MFTKMLTLTSGPVIGINNSGLTHLPVAHLVESFNYPAVVKAILTKSKQKYNPP